jgi:flagellar basal-body rod modification protein FlgD
MNEINDFSNLGLSAPPPQAGGRDELGQEDFLKLMMTQFQNQDPFSPMENGDFLGQLAQFGTVNGIEQLNGAFSGLQNSIQNDQALQAANLVGHSVLAEADVSYLGDDSRIAGAVELYASVSDVEVEITDVQGQLIRRLNLGEQPPGLARFEWDGSTQDGSRAEPGNYRIATRVIQGGYIESAQPLLESKIESVSLGGLGQGLSLNVSGGGTLSLNDVRRIL